MRFRIGRRRLIARPGEQYVVAPGVKHAFKNVGKTQARARAVVRPAQEMQEFLEEAAALAREGLYTRLGAPTGLKAAARMAQFVERYRDVAVVCWPPRPFQRLLLGPAKLLSRG